MHTRTKNALSGFNESKKCVLCASQVEKVLSVMQWHIRTCQFEWVECVHARGKYAQQRNIRDRILVRPNFPGSVDTSIRQAPSSAMGDPITASTDERPCGSANCGLMVPNLKSISDDDPPLVDGDYVRADGRLSEVVQFVSNTAEKTSRCPMVSVARK